MPSATNETKAKQPMNPQPLLSVIIPLYNCGRFVIQCLDSIYAQQLAESEFEVIVVDDGSTDNGAALVAQYARGHGNLQLLRQENQGVACARNHALCKACGDYVTFVDADDLLVSGSLKPLLQVAVEHDAEVVKAAHVEIAEETTDHDCKEVVREDFVRKMSGGDAIVHVTRFKEGYCWGYLIRRSLVADHAITFPGKVSFMEDWAFITRVLLKCRTFVHTGILFYLYRRNAASCVANMSVEKLLQGCRAVDIVATAAADATGQVRKKLMDNVCVNVNIMLWFTIHYTRIYRRRREIVGALHRLLAQVDRGSIPRSLVVFRLFPELYMLVRRLLASRKY